ncbi:MAG TPA: diguanylate cyclase [Acidisarcina sp.]
MKAIEVSYNYWLVAISVITSIVASYGAFSFAERVAATKKTRSALWLSAGAVSMGLGIWSMHYVGMLAVRLPVEVTYHVFTVILSLLLAVLASAGTLALVSRERMGPLRIGLGGVFMGAAIGGMHYTGMAAMRSTAMHHYNLPMVGVSVIVAVAFSCMSLWIAFAARLDYGAANWRRTGGAVLMGSGIAAMHYTAMAAVTFLSGDMAYSAAGNIKMSTLGIAAVVLTSTLMLAATMVAAFYDRRNFRALQSRHEQLTSAQAALIESEQALREANSKLNVLAVHDGLTGIHNRRYFDEIVAVELKRAARARTSISLLMIDVDHFKKLNDRYGHLLGDDALRSIAQGLKVTALRVEDTVARYGGEEFAVLLPGADAKGAFKIAETLRVAVERLHIRNEDSPIGAFATVSIGIDTRIPETGDLPDVMVAAADLALYRAKTQGRNRVVESSTAACALPRPEAVRFM